MLAPRVEGIEVSAPDADQMRDEAPFKGHETALEPRLQDVGKLALPPSIVHKPGALDHDELELMHRHPEHGLDLLREEDIGPGARSVIRFDHESWDGGGYPIGLAGTEIPVLARIAAIADALVAAPSQQEGVAALRAGAGRAFDPGLVELLADVAMARSPGLLPRVA